MAKGMDSVLTGSFHGMTTKKVVDSVPSRWKRLPALRGIGWRYIDENGVERIRFMAVSSNHPEIYPDGYWVRRDEKGRFLDVQGKRISRRLKKDDRLSLGHIPYTGGEKQLRGFD